MEMAVVIEGMREENCSVKVVSAKPVNLTPSALLDQVSTSFPQ